MTLPTSSSPTGIEVFCVFCGFANPQGNDRCSQCDRALFLGSSQSDVREQAKETPAPEEEPRGGQPAPPAPTRGINTKQMIVMWYGALALVAVAVVSGSSTVSALVGILAFTGMAVFTLSQHPNVRKKIVALWVIGPILLLVVCAVGFVYFSRSSNRISDISPDSIALFDLHMSLGSGCGVIDGRVRNHSGRTVKSVKFRMTLSDSTGPIDGADATTYVEVPPGETRSFSTTECGLRESPGWTWNYNVLEVRGD